ncbi:MAG: pyroglutamyl-peptidase I [Acidobacteria bacterium]|nr:pyroglutamyl-peptidase I [Acidobacteriota bacterium]
MRNATVLVTGFEPFGGEAVNPSWLAAQRLDGARILGKAVAAAQLPTVFATALPTLDAWLSQHDPCLVLCVGQAQGETGFCLERVAVNWTDARIPDNAGAQPVDLPVLPGGPPAHFATLPLRSILQALHRAGLPARISHSAGAFVCNHVFYGLMQALAARPACRGGFVHIPLLPEQAVRNPGQPSLSLDLVEAGLRIILETGLRELPG